MDILKASADRQSLSLTQVPPAGHAMIETYQIPLPPTSRLQNQRIGLRRPLS